MMQKTNCIVEFFFPDAAVLESRPGNRVPVRQLPLNSDTEGQVRISAKPPAPARFDERFDILETEFENQPPKESR